MEWIIITGIIGILILGVTIFRGNLDRRGIRAGDDSLKQLGKGIDKAGKTNKKLGNGIDKAHGITELIDSHNLSATNGIRTAKDILENAKRR